MIGARVEVLGQDGIWTISKRFPAASPPSWRCIQWVDSRMRAVDAVSSQLTLVSGPPTFTPGTKVPIGDGDATVVEDMGDDVVVTKGNLVPAAGIRPHRRWTGQRVVSKGTIVAHQI